MTTKVVSLDELGDSLIKLSKDINRDIEDSVKSYVVDLTSDIFEKSPFLTGLFRSNHHVSLGSRDEREFSITSKSTVVGDARSKVNEFTLNSKKDIFIQNDLDYAGKLESGWSSYAPSGVYGVSAKTKAFRIKMKGL